MFRRILCTALLFAVAAPASAEPEARPLVWHDEFDGPAGQLPDRARWQFDIGTDWGNLQLEFDTDRSENVSLDGEPARSFDFEIRSPIALRSSEAVSAPPPQGGEQASRSCIPATQCCKICSKGKACGNSCISRRYTCRKGRGCACDAVEVCR